MRKMSRLNSKTTGEETVRDRLLNAAEKVAVRDGVVGLTLDAVAREAGVSKGGLLYHFPSKSALITSLVERVACYCEAEQGKIIEGDALASGAFTRAYVEARREPCEAEEVPLHCALLAAAGSDPQYLEPFRNRISGWQARIESDGLDPVTATIVRLAVDGLALGRLLGIPLPSPEVQEAVVKRLIEMTMPARTDEPAGKQEVKTVER